MTDLTPAQDGVLSHMRRDFDAAHAVVSAALRAPELPRDELGIPNGSPPSTMSEVEARIAGDALQPQRNAPVYLQMARGLVELKAKLDAGLGDDAPKLVNHVVYVVKAREYERVELNKVIDVDAKEVKNG